MKLLMRTILLSGLLMGSTNSYGMDRLLAEGGRGVGQVAVGCTLLVVFLGGLWRLVDSADTAQGVAVVATADSKKQETLEDIQELDFSNQNLADIPENVRDMKNLKKLILTGNPRIQIKDSSLPVGLECLILDACNLHVVPSGIKNIGLKLLSLKNSGELQMSESDLLGLEELWLDATEQLPRGAVLVLDTGDVNVVKIGDLTVHLTA